MKKLTRMKKAAAALTIVVILITLCSLYFLVDFGETKPELVEDHLFVDATYLLKTGETNTSVNVTCTLYLTNIWEQESGEIKATVFVIESENNLAVYKNAVSIGTISADSTAEVEIPIVFSNSSYKIEILIFEDDKLVIKGSINLYAYPVIIMDKLTHDYRQEWQVLNEGSNFYNVRSDIH